jgi:5-hydroxyisourate hydrolase
VLDTARGEPAAGIAVALYREEQLVANGTTGDDGRIASLGESLEPGLYRIVFDSPGRFFERVSLDVRLEQGHTHVPLLLAPFGATTYRGS